MSEYIEITTEEGEDNDSLYLLTNLRLTDGAVEEYDSQQALEFGSAVAQALSAVNGLLYVRLEAGDIFVMRQPDEEWHGIIEDVTAVLKDFFL